MPVVWILVAVLLIAIEMHHLAFFAVFGAAGAVGATAVAFAAPHAILAQFAVAIGVAAIGVVVVRPYVSRAFAQRSSGVRIGGVHGGLIAAKGITLDDVGVDVPGHVRILGERWLAVSNRPHPIPADTRVIVTDVTGTTLTVRPAEEDEEPT